jgi:UDP-glucose 4-epimerase
MGAILVTGGAGYIGSHVVRQLGERREPLHVLDNLSSGFRSAVLCGELTEGDTTNQRQVSELLEAHAIDSVLHFAASIVVPESVENPLKYYRNNTGGTRNLLECCVRAGNSVHEVLAMFATVGGRETLGWRPRHADLEAIARSALAWERRLAG